MVYILQVAQATSNQISRRDPLRPYMDVIDTILTQMVMLEFGFRIGLVSFKSLDITLNFPVQGRSILQTPGWQFGRE